MRSKSFPSQHLTSYLESIQSRGRLTFTSEEAIPKLGVSQIAFNRSAERLMKKNRLLHPARGFYVIVPVEKQLTGNPDPSWFIDALMKFHGQPYYVALLSAASFHGSAHQAPQEFQVMTNAQLKPIRVGRARIRFLKKKWVERTPTQPLKTPAGDIPISTPESTAFDLIQYVRWAGHLSHVTTVIMELAEKLEPKKLVAAAKMCGEITIAQRLGYLLDRFADSNMTTELHSWVNERNPSPTPLRPNWKPDKTELDTKWNLIVNEEVEPDV